MTAIGMMAVAAVKAPPPPGCKWPIAQALLQVPSELAAIAAVFPTVGSGRRCPHRRQAKRRATGRAKSHSQTDTAELHPQMAMHGERPTAAPVIAQASACRIYVMVGRLVGVGTCRYVGVLACVVSWQGVREHAAVPKGHQSCGALTSLIMLMINSQNF